MSRFIRIFAITWILSGTAFGQVFLPAHTHTPDCASLHLWDLPETRAAIAEYRAWEEAGRPGAIRKSLASQSVGTRKAFKTRDFVNNRYTDVTFELRYAGPKTDIWVEVAEFGPGKVTQAVIDTLAAALEQRTPALSRNPDLGILVNNTAVFGPRPNVDGTGRVTMLIHKIESSVEGSFIAGYFAGINLSLTDPNSNRADIIYLNSNPGIYTNTTAATAANIVATIAHEDQHLIHARAGGLNTFQNEGQSEWAELVNGYNGRSMAYLNAPEQVNQDLFTWRSSSADVLFDYARAGLFHTYLADRIGEVRVGSLSSVAASGLPAYNAVLSGTGIGFNTILSDFHVANWVNDAAATGGRFGYGTPQRTGTRAVNPALDVANVVRSASVRRSVRFGAAEYVRFQNVRDLNLSLGAGPGLLYHIVAKPAGSALTVNALNTGAHVFSGSYDELTVVVVNPGNLNEYTLNATWEPLPLITENLSYATASSFFAELPGDPSNPDRAVIRGYSLRISPTYDGEIERVLFQINGGTTAKRGNGTLRIALYSNMESGFETNTAIPRLVPQTELNRIDVPFAAIGSGTNIVDLRDADWIVQGGEEYHITFEVVSNTADARLEFLIDAGTTSVGDPAYYPVRTRVRTTSGNWGRWGNANIQLVSAVVRAPYTGPLVPPVLNMASNTSLTGTVGSSLTLTASASGTPAPQYIWAFNGSLLNTAGNRHLINPFSPSDAGEYTVRAANLAGITETAAFDVQAFTPEFRLDPNYPNPFNPVTSIPFSLSGSAAVYLEVFDLLGRRISAIETGDVFTAGVYERVFDAAGLASGVYVVRLRIRPVTAGPEIVLHRKMTLLK
jgi:hypothetical protein